MTSKPTVVVTGANRGIGLELARQLSAAGHSVIATARSPRQATELQQLAEEASDGAGEIRIEALDVASEESVAQLGERLAGTTIDTLINNAGIGGHRRSLFEPSYESYLDCFRVNCLGALRVTLALIDQLRAGSRRQVVNISSQLGSMALNTGGAHHAYRVSKAALNMVTRNLAAELGGEGFICVAFHPGWVRTDMGGEQAPLQATESVRGMLNVLGGLTRRDNGKFYDYAGKELPW